MGWAKYEEDNREAWTERNTYGAYLWNPYISKSAYKANTFKPATTQLQQTNPISQKHKSFAYGR